MQHVRFATEATPPAILRLPEVMHGLGNLVENAVDFASSRVSIEASWDEALITMIITDDDRTDG